ncbi:MAG: Hsp70 family protein [Deltaproteobacteria bacterium]|nr:Hsp70 family protein [Deltaproteobacteria bacterium]
MTTQSEIILGIDLGTTYSTAAAVINGQMHLAVDGRGEACIPSVVHFPKSGAPLVGVEAEKQRSLDPQNTVFGIKRLIGRGADSPTARVLDASAAFKIKPQPKGEAAVQVRTGTFAASEIAAMILRHLRERAEARFQRKIGKAVLTVPVLATPEVKAAMTRCGKMAGLEVLDIISEPVAGSIARGFGGPHWGEHPFLVYDFGGGTFDASVVQRAGEALQVLASGGDDCLGGDDFDLGFARWIADVVVRSHKVNVKNDIVLWDRVQRQCEQVRRALSAGESARYVLRDAGERIGKLEFSVAREDMRPLWAELVQRSMEASQQTVQESGVPLEELGAVLLIGGTTYVAQVREAVAELGVQCAIEADPQTAVARGAARVATQRSMIHRAVTKPDLPAMR